MPCLPLKSSSTLMIKRQLRAVLSLGGCCTQQQHEDCQPFRGARREDMPPEAQSSDAASDSSTDVTIPQFTPALAQKFDFPKVELHLHLDGAVRFSTLWEMCNEKNMPIEGVHDVESLKKKIISTTPSSLSQLLDAFKYILPRIAGDVRTIERVAYETCESQHRNGVIYFEGRYSPHFLANTGPGIDYEKTFHKYGPVTALDVVKAVHAGFERGRKDFGVEARSILCCIRLHDQWNEEVLELVAKHQHDYNVVGIDVAGCAEGADEKYEPSCIAVFKKAYELGLHRTVHSGESGTDKEVLMALEEMKAERIGHGYRVMRNAELYRTRFVEKHDRHIEGCPFSSVISGSVPLDWPHHPIRQWAHDDVNFSISRDDPTCFGNSMCSELDLAFERIGLTKTQLWQCQLNAARSAFCDDVLREKLIAKILQAKPLTD